MLRVDERSAQEEVGSLPRPRAPRHDVTSVADAAVVVSGGALAAGDACAITTLNLEHAAAGRAEAASMPQVNYDALAKASGLVGRTAPEIRRPIRCGPAPAVFHARAAARRWRHLAAPLQPGVLVSARLAEVISAAKAAACAAGVGGMRTKAAAATAA